MISCTDLKEGVTISEVLDGFGIRHRRNRCACPVHNGDNPTALSFNDKTFYCHTRGCKGDVIDLIKALGKTDFKGALKYLAKRQGLAYDSISWQSPNSCSEDLASWQAQPEPFDHQGLILENLRHDYNFCKECMVIVSARLRKLRRLQESGRISLSDFYLGQQKLDDWLDELDAEEAHLNYEIRNFKRKAKSNGIR